MWKDPPRQGTASERSPDAATGASPAQTDGVCNRSNGRSRLRQGTLRRSGLALFVEFVALLSKKPDD